MKINQESQWQLIEKNSPEAVQEALLDFYQKVGNAYFNDANLFNLNIGFLIHKPIQTKSWLIGSILTPWMFAEFFIPLINPKIKLPENWTKETRQTAEYENIGPIIEFDIINKKERAHIQYDTTLGHFLLRPLVQSLKTYQNADAVIAAWQEVLDFRKKTYQALMQAQNTQTVNRRQFLRLGK